MKRKNQKRKANSGFSFYELMIVLAVIGILALVAYTVLRPVSRTYSYSYRIACMNNLKQIGIAYRLIQGDFQGNCGLYLTTPPTNDLPVPPNAAEIRAATNNGPSPFTYQVFGVMSNELNTPKLIVCPSDERVAQTNFSMVSGTSTDGSKLLNQNVSYFVGRDAQIDQPKMLLGGDRNLGTGATGPNSEYGYSPASGMNAGFAKELGLTNTAVQWTAKMHKKQGNVLFADGHVENLTSIKFREALRVTGDTNGTATKGNFILFP